jgi:endonuclease/exonuclease/phosphatase family metal-dependent hydrolase
MKKLLVSLICVLLSGFTLFSCSDPKDPGISKETSAQIKETQTNPKPKQHFVTCMSYNILNAGGEADDLPPPAVRYPYILDFLLEYKTDILCLQEVASGGRNWFLNLPKDLEAQIDYSHISYKALSGNDHQTSTGLFIFYKNEIFDLVDSGYQTYTDTEKQTRVFIWAQLYDKVSQKTVFVTNTHWSINWDSQGNTSAEAGDEHRTKQANELLAFFKDKVGDNVLFACGDYNCRNDSKWAQILASDVYKDGGTVLLKGRGGVDMCFINPGAASIRHYEYIKLRFNYGGTECRYSDHNPLLVRVRY